MCILFVFSLLSLSLIFDWIAIGDTHRNKTKKQKKFKFEFGFKDCILLQVGCVSQGIVDDEERRREERERKRSSM